MKPNSGFTQLKYVNNEENALDEESYSETFKIKMTYQNIDDEKYEVEFILNQEYNDGFAIKYQRKIDE